MPEVVQIPENGTSLVQTTGLCIQRQPATHCPTCSTNCCCTVGDLSSVEISTPLALTAAASTRRWRVCCRATTLFSSSTNRRTRPATYSTSSLQQTVTVRLSLIWQWLRHVCRPTTTWSAVSFSWLSSVRQSSHSRTVMSKKSTWLRSAPI